MRSVIFAFRHIGKKILRHKVLSGILAILVIGGGIYGVKRFGGNVAPRYLFAYAAKGTVAVSVTGSGQVAASNEVEIKAKASGDVVAVRASEGEALASGAVIVELDARDAQKAVRDAEANLLSARLALEKLRKPADALSIIQAENALARAREAKDDAVADLLKAYDDGFNAVANAFLDLPTVIAGLQDLLYGITQGLSGNIQANIDYYASIARPYDNRVDQFRDDADAKYQRARREYDGAFDTYKAASRFSPPNVITALIGTTYETTKRIAEAVKSANNLIQFYTDTLTARNLPVVPTAATHLTTLITYTGKTNTHLVSLLNAKTAIEEGSNAIVDAERTITERAESLRKLKEGPDALDIQSAELTVRQRQNALLDAREKLADYFIRAPFDGKLATLNVKKSDSVGNGAAVAQFITAKKLAEISLNEVDAAKISVGDRATLTFDAIPDLTISGEVAEIDAVGTVSQGVVTYGVKISFDAQDERVKPGMTVTAAIITEAKENVLTVPNSAVKRLGEGHYVEAFDPPLPRGGNGQGVVSEALPQRRIVRIGLVNETLTEITSGLKEGDQVVVRTISDASSQAARTQAPSIFSVPGQRSGTGSVRFPR